MIKVNYFKMKYKALENFFLWVGQGSAYGTAWDQNLYYYYDLEPESQELEEVVRIISMAVRLKKHGEPASLKRDEILEAIAAYDNLNLNRYCFTEKEFLAFTQAVEEAKQYVGYPARTADKSLPDTNLYQKGEIDFFQIKCAALETFFDSVEQGRSYQEAAERCTDSGHVARGRIGEIITAFTITIRFNLWGKEISDLFEGRLQRAVEGYSELDLEKLGLTEDEIEDFQGDFSEASAYLSHYRRHREES